MGEAISKQIPTQQNQLKKVSYKGSIEKKLSKSYLLSFVWLKKKFLNELYPSNNFMHKVMGKIHFIARENRLPPAPHPPKKAPALCSTCPKWGKRSNKQIILTCTYSLPVISTGTLDNKQLRTDLAFIYRQPLFKCVSHFTSLNTKPEFTN